MFQNIGCNCRQLFRVTAGHWIDFENIRDFQPDFFHQTTVRLGYFVGMMALSKLVSRAHASAQHLRSKTQTAASGPVS